MKIIPAIDLINGQCVRLTEGNYDTKKIYAENPVEIAQFFEEKGGKYLHLVDLDGAKKGEVINWNILESITKKTNLKVDFSGGIKNKNSVQKAFDLGANQVIVGSIALKNPALVKDWLQEFGNEKIVLSADVRQEKIAVNGWQTISEMNIYDFLTDFLEAGLKYVVCTDIEKDGKLAGVSLELYQKIIQKFPTIELIASGGVHDIEDIISLQNNQLSAVIIGKALYEEKISWEDLANFL
ncbi:MAG: 1-(5-phosphoribosyl)-5-[(5-phosphoribosylamino)methylideneamino]imidazole-4-carboxamide isomerase [Bacteroidetes bacterium]|nr:MAG: 1-(5-phosphoribosyl)-5-[(5-phosphoribosylamino)methylideneamino]imidazole-4-carboxamide isomerase [Bacteroidota bacterium]TAG88306.1 MAG: 1-(5-phosphoribosyl)-5-[(5-phosphoribosylamino)methylideneamino]imidazole-4-carboxamide isomerase [Bacteroidota bacterium]